MEEEEEEEEGAAGGESRTGRTTVRTEATTGTGTGLGPTQASPGPPPSRRASTRTTRWSPYSRGTRGTYTVKTA